VCSKLQAKGISSTQEQFVVREILFKWSVVFKRKKSLDLKAKGNEFAASKTIKQE